MDVIHQQNALVHDQCRVRRVVDPQHVGPPCSLALQAGLRRVILNFIQQADGLGAPMAAHGLRQQPGLVIASLFQPLCAHRHPSHTVKFSPEPLRRTPGQQLAQRLRQRGAAPEFQAQQGVPHRALVPQRRGAGQILFRFDHLFLRKPRQVLLALGADAHGVQDFAAKGAFRREEEIDDAFKKMIHFSSSS